jgi:hypothetical protein
MKKIIKYVKELYPELEHIELITDGCAGQFKNRFYVSNLEFAKAELGVTTRANFYSTHHGKSRCDSIGGTLKRNVFGRILTGEHTVYNAKEFVACAKTFVKEIIVWSVDQKDVIESVKLVQPRWTNTVTVSGTQGYHSFRPVPGKPGFVECAETSLGDGLQVKRVLKKNFLASK